MKLHHTIQGNGPHLIIMHGLFGMADNWNTLARQWAENYTVHLLDLRNHGRSPHSPNFSYELMAQDLGEYYQSQGIEKAHVLGHSMGGKVAMLFAVLNPEKVEKLIIADIGPKAYPPHHQEVLEALHGLDLSKISSRKQAQDQFGEGLDASTQQFLLKSLYWQEKGKLAWRFNLKGISENINEVGSALPQQAYYPASVLFIKGGASNYITALDENLIFQHFPEAKIESIPEAGHWLHAQKPKEFDSLVSDYLSA